MFRYLAGAELQGGTVLTTGPESTLPSTFTHTHCVNTGSSAMYARSYTNHTRMHLPDERASGYPWYSTSVNLSQHIAIVPHSEW
jgi:hypothetical protein